MVDSTIKAALNACTRFEKPLEADSEWRVELHETGAHGEGYNPIERLKTVITASEAPTLQLFSGFIGSGKSTELKKLVSELEQEGYTPLLLDYEDYFNLYEPPNINDLFASIASGLDEFIKNSCGGGIRPYWDRVLAFVKSVSIGEVGIEAGILNAAKLKVKFKREPNFKARLYEHLEKTGRIGELAEASLNFLDESVAVVNKKFKNSKGLVVLLDTFEKVRGSYRNAGVVKEAIGRIFIDESSRLLRIPFHTVYTVPQWLRFCDVGAAFPRRMMTLPMCKLRDERSGEPFPSGFDAMREILKKRMTFEEIFEDAEPIEQLIEASGGYPRDLLRMMSEALLNAVMSNETAPISKQNLSKFIDEAIEAQIADFDRAISTENLELLVEVDRTRDVPRNLPKDEIFRIADLFDYHFILAYRNGQEWYDLHPLVRKTPTVQRALQKDEDDAARTTRNWGR